MPIAQPPKDHSSFFNKIKCTREKTPEKGEKGKKSTYIKKALSSNGGGARRDFCLSGDLCSVGTEEKKKIGTNAGENCSPVRKEKKIPRLDQGKGKNAT